MKTNQIMETRDRELCGLIVRQRTKDGFMNLNDIADIVYQARIQNGLGVKGFNFNAYISSEGVKEFLEALEIEIGTNPYIRGAKNRPGWIHPFFALKILTHFNPRFEVQVYKWLWDYLIENRIKSSDSYTIMSGVLYKYSKSKTEFPKNLRILADRIKRTIGVERWNEATQEQLQRRDELQTYISDFARTFKDSNQGVRMAMAVWDEKYPNMKFIKE